MDVCWTTMARACMTLAPVTWQSLGRSSRYVDRSASIVVTAGPLCLINYNTNWSTLSSRKKFGENAQFSAENAETGDGPEYDYHGLLKPSRSTRCANGSGRRAVGSIVLYSPVRSVTGRSAWERRGSWTVRLSAHDKVRWERDVVCMTRFFRLL